MAWYDIERACGHNDRIQIYGTNSHGEREKRAEWEATKLCRDCYLKKLEEQRAEENAKATISAAEAGLPKLTGSDKQVAWANSIRAKVDLSIPQNSDSSETAIFVQKAVINMTQNTMRKVGIFVGIAIIFIQGGGKDVYE